MPSASVNTESGCSRAGRRPARGGCC